MYTSSLIIIILIYIAYKLTDLASQIQVFTAIQKLKHKQKNNSTLNPLFSEEVIAHMKAINEKNQKCIDDYFEKLIKQEKEEIEIHEKLGKDKNNFHPSEELLDIIVLTSAAIVGRNNATRNYQKMIESNIAILNGDSIEKIEKIYYENTPGTVWNPSETTMSTGAWLLDKQVKEMYEGFLKDRKEFWKDSWTYILEKSL